MFRQILYTQWKSAKIGLGILAVAGFGLPLMAIQDLTQPVYISTQGEVTADVIFSSWQLWLPFFPALAGLAGVGLALNAWNWDHKTGHIYSLSLPVTRWEYALLKAAAGALLLMIPVGMLAIGSFTAVAALELPNGLHAYPAQFIGRFLLASLLVYMFWFALASSTMKTVGIILGVFLTLTIGGQITWDILDNFITLPGGADPADWFFARMVEWPGPFNVLFGNWMLIDV
jgi:hypothetical protein